MQMYILKINLKDIGDLMICEAKIELYNKNTIQKYLKNLENVVRNTQPTTYFLDTFNNFVLNITRTSLKHLKTKIFNYLRNHNLTNTQNVYYILGEYNNFGIQNVYLQNDKLILELQFELYYKLKDFVNISGCLSNSNLQIYTHCIYNDETQIYYNLNEDSNFEE